MERGYSTFVVKAVDEAQRLIEGVASTPSVDRIGDVVEPLGARFTLPLPLLWQHMHDQPIGFVEWAQPRADGIPFRARLAKVAEAGRLRDRLDEAWQSIRAGLVRGVSIGFKALKVQPTATGVRFTEWEWFELSACTIPANQDANIQTIKAAFDASITSDQTPPSSLWREVEGVGRAAYDRVKATAEKASPSMRVGLIAHETSRDMIKALAGKVEELEHRLAGSTTRYVGVWATNARYSRGDLVTHCGNIWHCDQPTNSKPGDDFNAWTLACRKGRDGKDAKP